MEYWEDQWHNNYNRLHLAALENGIIGLLFSVMWKSLHPRVGLQSRR